MNLDLSKTLIIIADTVAIAPAIHISWFDNAFISFHTIHLL